MSKDITTKTKPKPKPTLRLLFHVFATVNARGTAQTTVVFRDIDYFAAEDFCRAFTGDVIHLEIKKLWVPK